MIPTMCNTAHMPWWKVSTETTAATKPSSARFGAVMSGGLLSSRFPPPDLGIALASGASTRRWRVESHPYGE